ncbi:ankyrin repeat domain-containing protein 66-like [Clavelina lepadiformis]|uniref:ankyrin repeat domain-containing protein 66-like n=1 Tax=Clavelina lepadiformis TaxID=159417 RepID=UPI004041B57E
MTQETKLSELHEVCAVGDADSLEEMLINGKFERLDYKDPDWGGRAPLHWCCIKGKSDMLQSLLDRGAHPGVRTECGWTPAHYAAESGRTHVLRMLHQYNAPMNRKDLFGDTPCRIAEIYGHKETVEFLKIAETEYRNWRRNAELSSEVDQHDDEDLEWCYRNGVQPDVFVTPEEIEDGTRTVSTVSLSDTTVSSGKPRSFVKSYHYPKPGLLEGKKNLRRSSNTSRKSSISKKKLEQSDKQRKSQKSKDKTAIKVDKNGL